MELTKEIETSKETIASLDSEITEKEKASVNMKNTTECEIETLKHSIEKLKVGLVKCNFSSDSKILCAIICTI